MKKLSRKEKLFCLYYAQSRNGREAAAKAGFVSPEQAALRREFPEIPDEDLERLAFGGCTETMLEGVSMIALRSGAPVIPAYIGGPFRLFRKTQVSFGKPVSFEGLPRRMDSDTLDAATRRIEAAVWSLKDA